MRNGKNTHACTQQLDHNESIEWILLYKLVGVAPLQVGVALVLVGVALVLVGVALVLVGVALTS